MTRTLVIVPVALVLAYVLALATYMVVTQDFPGAVWFGGLIQEDSALLAPLFR